LQQIFTKQQKLFLEVLKQKKGDTMEIQRSNYTPSFSARFANDKSFREVAQYAQEKGCLRTLDGALNVIKKANPGNISIIHGRTPEGKIYSTFTTGRRSVTNYAGEASCPAEATFNGILELSMLGKKFKSLLGVSKIEQDITAEKIIKEYTV